MATVTIQEAPRGSDLWTQARAFADARALDYILVHADLHEPQASRARVFCAFREDTLAGVGVMYRVRHGDWLSLGALDGIALTSLAQTLIREASGHCAFSCREQDAVTVRRATGLTGGEREVHRVLRGPAHAGDPALATRTGEGDWGKLTAFYERLAGQVFFADVFRANPSYYIELDGKVVAAALCHFRTPQVLQIGAVLTDPDYRRRGLAASLVAAMAAEAHASGRLTSLFVRADNESATALYEKLGFTRHQTIVLLIPGDAAPPDPTPFAVPPLPTREGAGG